MKVNAAKAEASVQNPPTGVRAFLLYGPDTGSVAARAGTLVAQVVPDAAADPFNIVRIDPEDMRGDKARLADELAATTLMGGLRVVNCRGFGERERAGVEAALEVSEGTDNRLVISAGDLAGSSKLRKLFETRADCLAVPCYADEGRSLSEMIRHTLGQANMEADRDALAALTGALGADRSLSLRELEKLITYVEQPGPVRAEDVTAVIADASPLGLDAFVYGVTQGDMAGADAALRRLLSDGQAPIRLHNALAQHLNKFVTVLSAGGDIGSAAQALRPPLFWKVKETFIGQAQRMRLTRLMEGVRLSIQAGAELRVSALPPDLVLARLTLKLCYLFKR